MCLAMPGRVVAVDPESRTGRVEVFGTPRAANLTLLTDVAPGDWVLVQAGLAVEKIDAAAAQETIRLYEQMAAAFEAQVARSEDER